MFIHRIGTYLKSMLLKSKPSNWGILLCSLSLLLLAYRSSTGNSSNRPFKMPYKKVGLCDRQAAAHLLNRFTYGATPETIDELLKIGPEKWFQQQLDGKLPDTAVERRLQEYDALQLSNRDVLRTFPRGGKVIKEAVQAGYIHRDSANEENKGAYKGKVAAFMLEKGYRPEQELFRQFVSQKIIRAAYSNNQLHQVLTDFWFNHFNVSATKNNCSQFIPAYERDVIRPNVAGKFYDLLLATAQSPAMLFYLDNFNSTGVNESVEKRRQRLQELAMTDTALIAGAAREKLALLKKKKNNQGLNENYARELMELHTMGVDGGYTQQDVTQAARILTGWTVFPMEENGLYKEIRKRLDEEGEDGLAKKGFVHNNDFLFAINRHDNGQKQILNRTFAADGGYNEGVELLRLLAQHPSTAKFICTKLAIRFVNDDPSPALIAKMVTSFKASDGDIKQVLMAMVSAPEFWQKEALREKTKSPFELSMSAIRALHADVASPIMLNQWIIKMGQKLYYYQAPTGFPDRANYWINTGSLLSRMNFGLAFAAGKVPGVTFDLAALNQHHEPESAAAALATYCKIILPERDVQATIQRLTPLINNPEFEKKVLDASSRADGKNNSLMSGDNVDEPLMVTGADNVKISDEKRLARRMLRKADKGADHPMISNAGNNSMLAQVVGIILGSPEFQRR